MSYEVHITRKAAWDDAEGPAISLAEWLKYVASDPEMRADGFADAKTSDGLLRVEDPGIAVWTTFPGHGIDGNMAWFSHFGDHITVKSPDTSILRKMHRIARTLGATVQGDEGEHYDAEGSSDGASASPRANHPKPWWKLWGGN